MSQVRGPKARNRLASRVCGQVWFWLGPGVGSWWVWLGLGPGIGVGMLLIYYH